MGYKLYASMGTGDFYSEHGVDVSTKLTLSYNTLRGRVFVTQLRVQRAKVKGLCDIHNGHTNDS